MQPVQIILIVALLIYVIVRRLQGLPLRIGRVLVVPLVVLALGVSQLTHLEARDIALLTVKAVVGLGLGALRGATIALYERRGYLWFRYRPVTVAIWLATVAVRVVLQIGLPVGSAGSASLTVALAVSLLGEGVIVAVRAQRTRVAFAPHPRTARATVAPDAVAPDAVSQDAVSEGAVSEGAVSQDAVVWDRRGR
jgi:hypothetical protein